MKLELELDEQILAAEFRTSNGDATLTIAEKNYSATISEPEPGWFTVIINDHVYLCALNQLPNGATEIIVNGKRIPVTVRDLKRMRTGAGGVAAGKGKAVLTAPMPGKIVRLLKAVGDEVEADQGVLVVEAMKMQNEVQSPKKGKVIELRVTEGQTVNAGETMAVIE